MNFLIDITYFTWVSIEIKIAFDAEVGDGIGVEITDKVCIFNKSNEIIGSDSCIDGLVKSCLDELQSLLFGKFGDYILSFDEVVVVFCFIEATNACSDHAFFADCVDCESIDYLPTHFFIGWV